MDKINYCVLSIIQFPQTQLTLKAILIPHAANDHPLYTPNQRAERTTPYILPIKEPRESIENIKEKMKDATMTCLWCRDNVAFILFFKTLESNGI